MIATMSVEQIGVYVQLLSLQWVEGSIPDDSVALAGILRMPDTQFAKAWKVIAPKFECIGDGRRANRRMELDRQRLKNVSPGTAEDVEAAARWSQDAGSAVGSRSAPNQPEDVLSLKPIASGSHGGPSAFVSPRFAAGQLSRRRVRVEPPVVCLPPELEPWVQNLISRLAARNADGLISEGRVANIRLALKRALERCSGKWQFLAFGVSQAAACDDGRGSEDERYAVRVAIKQHDKGSLPKAWVEKTALKPLQRPPFPTEYNTWDERTKNKWMRDNGYAN